MPEELEIVRSYMQTPPFDAEGCARALGMHLLRRNIPSAIACHFSRRGPQVIVLSRRLDEMPGHSLRMAVSVGIAHFLLHRDLMWDAPHGDAVFKGFSDTGKLLSDGHEAQALRQASFMMAPMPQVRALVRDVTEAGEATSRIARHFNIPARAAGIYLDQARQVDREIAA